MENKKIEILFIVSRLTRCGPINVLYNIIKYMDKSVFNISLICLSKEKENSRKMDFENLGISIQNLNCNNFKDILFIKSQIDKYIIEKNIDIVHSHGIRADFINSRINMCKSINTFHSYPYNDYPMVYGKLKGNLMAYIHIKLIKYLDTCIACSKSNSEEFYLNNNIKLKYIQNGIDTSIFNYKKDIDKDKLRDKLRLPKQKKIFIVIGNVVEGKDPITIIECFKERNKNEEVLLIVGDGDLYEKSKQISLDNENIIAIGRVDNVIEYINASDYYISASLAEGLPNSVMEAMALGLPCILSDIKPHIEINNYSKLGVSIFKVKNILDLSKKIDKMLECNYEKMSLENRETIQRHLSAENMSIHYQKEYLKLLNK